MDTIASCAFGVDAQSFQNQNSPFVKHANGFFKFSATEAFKFFVGILPFGAKLMNFLNIPFSKVEETEFFYNVITETLNQRRQSSSKRNDLVDMMIDAINGKLSKDENEEKSQFDKDSEFSHQAKEGQMDDISIAATAMVFLIAGYDTTGTALSYACYQLSKNPGIQDKLRIEIDDIIDDPKDLSYTDVQTMEYLDAVICETLRFHNLIAILARCMVVDANKEYRVPGTDVVLPPYSQVEIDVPAIHFDPEHYTNPLVFDPEHFSKEAKSARHP